MIRTLAAALAVVGLLAVGTACGAPGGSIRAAPSAGGLADPFPPRPREIRLDGLDPCALVGPEVLTQVGVPDTPRAVPGKTPGTRRCTWERGVLQRPSGALTVFVATQQDTRNVLSVDGAQVTTVAGFGAVELPEESLGAQFSCGVRVDVAPHEGLWVLYLNLLRDEPGVTHERLCQRVHTAAETIMRDLLARTK